MRRINAVLMVVVAVLAFCHGQVLAQSNCTSQHTMPIYDSNGNLIGSETYVTGNCSLSPTDPPPVVTIISPTAGQQFEIDNGIITFRYDIEDQGDCIKTDKVDVDGVIIRQDIFTDPTVCVTFLTTSLNITPLPLIASFFGLGTHIVTVAGTNRSGQTTKASVSFKVIDSFPPIVTVYYPLQNSVFGPNSTVIALYNMSDISNISLEQVLLDGIVKVNNAYSPTLPSIYHIFSVSSSTLASGTHTLTFIATNGAGLTTTVTRQFVVDTTPPVITINEPKTPDVKTYGLNETIPIDVLIEDAESGVGAYSVIASAPEGASVTIGSGDAQGLKQITIIGSILGSQLGLGIHTLFVNAQDTAGNKAPQQQKQFQVVPGKPSDLTQAIKDCTKDPQFSNLQTELINKVNEIQKKFDKHDYGNVIKDLLSLKKQISDPNNGLPQECKDTLNSFIDELIQRIENFVIVSKLPARELPTIHFDRTTFIDTNGNPVPKNVIDDFTKNPKLLGITYRPLTLRVDRQPPETPNIIVSLSFNTISYIPTSSPPSTEEHEAAHRLINKEMFDSNLPDRIVKETLIDGFQDLTKIPTLGTTAAGEINKMISQPNDEFDGIAHSARGGALTLTQIAELLVEFWQGIYNTKLSNQGF